MKVISSPFQLIGFNRFIFHTFNIHILGYTRYPGTLWNTRMSLIRQGTISDWFHKTTTPVRILFQFFFYYFLVNNGRWFLNVLKRILLIANNLALHHNRRFLSWIFIGIPPKLLQLVMSILSCCAQINDVEFPGQIFVVIFVLFQRNFGIIQWL